MYARTKTNARVAYIINTTILLTMIYKGLCLHTSTHTSQFPGSVFPVFLLYCCSLFDTAGYSWTVVCMTLGRSGRRCAVLTLSVLLLIFSTGLLSALLLCFIPAPFQIQIGTIWITGMCLGGCLVVRMHFLAVAWWCLPILVWTVSSLSFNHTALFSKFPFHVRAQGLLHFHLQESCVFAFAPIWTSQPTGSTQ